MREDYLRKAQTIITDPNILINVVSSRVKQLRDGAKPMIESLERLDLEDVAMRELIEGKLRYSVPSLGIKDSRD
ncbi:MAG: DNA-directed RNA polymerase subunit omega [Verrucomicrobia bacterium 21-51-4]|nr:MAG: DNA-directed RNA polymerase subunit omega [Verrucomicrobia bacterium 21-51-4]